MKNQNEQLNRLFLPIDTILISVSYFLAWYLIIYLREDAMIGVLPQDVYFTALIIIVPVYLILYSIFGLYRSNRTLNVFTELSRIIEANILDLLI